MMHKLRVAARAMQNEKNNKRIQPPFLFPERGAQRRAALLLLEKAHAKQDWETKAFMALDIVVNNYRAPQNLGARDASTIDG